MAVRRLHGVFIPRFVGSRLIACRLIPRRKLDSVEDRVIEYDMMALRNLHRLLKLFNTNNIDIVRNCQKKFAFVLPSVLLAHRSERFLVKYRHCANAFCKLLLF